MDFNYKKISLEILKSLPERTREVVSRRFGLESGEKETLESIGKSHGITRERVRQIEEEGFSKLQPVKVKYQDVFNRFQEYINEEGGLKREDLLLAGLGENKFQNQVYFLLTLGDSFQRHSETPEFYSFWMTNKEAAEKAKKMVKTFYSTLKEKGQPVIFDEFMNFIPELVDTRGLNAVIEAAKEIEKGPEGLFGLKEWPEINPRGVRDKAYLVMKREKKPLHFTEVARLIGEFGLVNSKKPNIQTVHNELIRDDRFILVGRGIYALKEWGYEPGVVRELIAKIIKESGKSLTKEEIVEKVSKQRIVKENTILLNLQNKKHFTRDESGKYRIASVS